MKITFLKYYEIGKVAVNETLASPASFFGRLFIHVLRTGLFGVIYTYVYSENKLDEINGIKAIETIWSLAFVQLIYQTSRRTYRTLKEQIITGQIETKINKPYSFIITSFIETFAQVPLVLFIFTIVTILSLGTFFGFPSINISQIIALPVLTFLGIAIYIIVQQIIATVGFWIENPDPVYWITMKLSWIVNGTFVPVSILPQTFRLIADFFPISTAFFIGRIFEMDTFSQLLKYLLIQILWIVLLWIVLKILFDRAIRKISINGS